MKKYGLTSDVRVIEDKVLHRIISLIDFGNVKAGTMGGFVESENNLSQDGLAWVMDNACVMDDARVLGDAKVCGNACVRERASVMDEACVMDSALVMGGAEISGHAVVCDAAMIDSAAVVCDYAKVCGQVGVYESVTFNKNVVVGESIDYITVRNPFNGHIITWTRSDRRWADGASVGDAALADTPFVKAAERMTELIW